MSTLYTLYLRLLMLTGAPRLFSRLLRDPWYFGVLTGWTESLSIAPGASVLEMGCGPGRLSIHLQASGAKVVGIDRSAGMVGLAERAARNRASTARFRCTSSEDMATTAESFDWVIAASLLNVVANPLDVLRTAVQVTRPGGQGAFLVPSPRMTTPAARTYASRSSLGPFARAILGTWQRRARTMEPDRIVELMSEAGYQQIRTDFPMDGMLVSAHGQLCPSTAS